MVDHDLIFGPRWQEWVDSGGWKWRHWQLQFWIKDRGFKCWRYILNKCLSYILLYNRKIKTISRSLIWWDFPRDFPSLRWFWSQHDLTCEAEPTVRKIRDPPEVHQLSAKFAMGPISNPSWVFLNDFFTPIFFPLFIKKYFWWKVYDAKAKH